MRLLAEKIPTGMGKGRNQEKDCGDHGHILNLYFVSAQKSDFNFFCFHRHYIHTTLCRFFGPDGLP